MYKFSESLLNNEMLMKVNPHYFSKLNYVSKSIKLSIARHRILLRGIQEVRQKGRYMDSKKQQKRMDVDVK